MMGIVNTKPPVVVFDSMNLSSQNIREEDIFFALMSIPFAKFRKDLLYFLSKVSELQRCQAVRQCWCTVWLHRVGVWSKGLWHEIFEVDFETPPPGPMRGSLEPFFNF